MLIKPMYIETRFQFSSVCDQFQHAVALSCISSSKPSCREGCPLAAIYIILCWCVPLRFQ